MITALAFGARVLDEPEYASRAIRAAEFVWTKLRDDRSGVLSRRWRDGEAGESGQLDDHAYFAHGLLELYAATFDPVWLERAVEITLRQIERFWDEDHGGFFESPADPSIHVRLKDGHDGAEVAGNSIAAWNLQRLATVLDRDYWRRMAARTFDYYARRLEPFASAMPHAWPWTWRASAAPRRDGGTGGGGYAGHDRSLRSPRPSDDMLMVLDGGERQAVADCVVRGAAPDAGQPRPRPACVEGAYRLPTTDVGTAPPSWMERGGRHERDAMASRRRSVFVLLYLAGVLFGARARVTESKIPGHRAGRSPQRRRGFPRAGPLALGSS
jgi:hypothetical protein